MVEAVLRELGPTFDAMYHERGRVSDEGFDHSTFSKNRQRLLQHEVAQRFFAAVVEQARLCKYVSPSTAPCSRRGPR